MEPEVAYLSFAGPNGVGDIWDKIYEDGYSGGWAVENLRKNGGNVSFLCVSDR